MMGREFFVNGEYPLKEEGAFINERVKWSFHYD